MQLCALLAVGFAGLAPARTLADPVEDFYRGKTISVLIGVVWSKPFATLGSSPMAGFFGIML